MNKCGTLAGYMVHRRASEPTCRLCKDANNAHNKRYRENNPDVALRKKETNKEWVKNNPDKVSAKQKRYYSAHRSEQLQKSKKWKEENVEKNRLTRQVWWKNNRDKAAEYSAKRRALRMSTAHEPYTVAQIISIYGTTCYICKEPIDMAAPRKTGTEGWERGLHLDHVIPLKHGGVDAPENVMPSHGICNVTKQASILG